VLTCSRESEEADEEFATEETEFAGERSAVGIPTRLGRLG
jgi:hypothetical protein